MSFTRSPKIVSGQVEKLVNSLVLGTSVARLVGSSPTLPTRLIRLIRIILVGSIDTIDDTIDTGLIRSRKKGVLVVQGFKTYVSLRNYHHTFFFSQVGNRIVITHLFSKINRCTSAIVSYPIVSFLSYQALVQQKIRRMFTLCPTY